jgi:pilus assembly protein CpaB
MKKNISLVLLIAGIIVAILVGIGTYSWLQKRTAVKPTQTVVTQPVVVAAADLPWGTILNASQEASQVKTVDFLKTSLPQGSFSKPSEVEGRTLLYPVMAGEPIFDSQLAPTSVQAGGVGALISPKKRAIAFAVNKVIGVSGFIKPGNHVDVLVTIEGITKTVLENVRVLTVGPLMVPTGTQQNPPPPPPDVITMEVTTDEAEKLAMAATAGKVMLVLRNPTDTDSITTRGVNVPVLLASLGAPVAKSTGVSKKTMHKTVIINTSEPVVVQAIIGGEVTKYEFEGRGK